MIGHGIHVLGAVVCWLALLLDKSVVFESSLY